MSKWFLSWTCIPTWRTVTPQVDSAEKLKEKLVDLDNKRQKELEKIEECNFRLRGIKVQYEQTKNKELKKNAKTFIISRNACSQRALVLQNQIGNLQTTLAGVEGTQDSVEIAKLMKETTKDMKKMQVGIDLDKIDDIMVEVGETLDDIQTLNDMTSQSISTKTTQALEEGLDEELDALFSNSTLTESKDKTELVITNTNNKHKLEGFNTVLEQFNS